MNNIWQLLSNTPWWVYLILYFLIKLGLKASKTQIRPLKKLFIAPIIFTGLSLHTLLTSVNIDFFIVTCWLVAVLLGIGLGWLQVQPQPILVDKKNKLIQTPGTWSTLIIILIIFVSKYYFDYKLAIDPTIISKTGFVISLLSISGICSGLFIGKLINYLYRMRTQITVDLLK